MHAIPNSLYQNCHAWETSWLTGHLNRKRNKMSHLVHYIVVMIRNTQVYLHKPWILTHYFSLFPFKVRKKKIYINFIAAIAIAKLGFFFKSLIFRIRTCSKFVKKLLQTWICNFKKKKKSLLIKGSNKFLYYSRFKWQCSICGTE